jgi:hypothetical protein
MTPQIDSGPGLQSDMSVNSQPVIPDSSMASQPHVWSWIWFAVAVLIVLGFHIRVFGQPIPPAAKMP